ncbi:hypothetical protein BBJ28_00005126, partial [Nothophytophthora sp. Chile5]
MTISSLLSLRIDRVGETTDRLVVAMRQRDDSIDALLAEFDKSLCLSRRVFQDHGPETDSGFADLEGGVLMDIDAGADDFFAALDNGDAEDVFAGFGAPEATNGATASPTAGGSGRPSLDDEPLVVTKRKKAEATKKAARKDAIARAAAAKAAKEADGPALPMEERIVNLLVPELKVNDVMLLIKKMKQAGKSDADEFSELDAEQKTGILGTNIHGGLLAAFRLCDPPAPRFRCETCGNTEQNNFITDYARGDTICNGLDGNGCGTVVQDHIVHEGSAYRKFEGEEDKSHHGPAPNKLFSTGHNLRTLISQMKQKACRLIDHTISNLDLHEIVGSRAKKMFAEFRDVREHVHQFDAMVAGCVIAAYMETGKEMYSAQNAIRIGKNKQAGIANLVLPTNKAVDEKKLHPFTCPLCDMKFNARRGMQFHKCAGKPEEDKRATSNGSELSPMVFPDQLQPIIEMKNGKKWFKCPVCARVYGKEESLAEHMVRHQNQS